MTKDDILQMAHEAEFVVSGNLVLAAGYGGYVGITDKLTRFAALVAAKAAADENEACAKLAQMTVCDTHAPTGVKIYGARVADAIRARHKKQKESKFSTFSNLPEPASDKITGPVQVYEDSKVWNDLRDAKDEQQ